MRRLCGVSTHVILHGILMGGLGAVVLAGPLVEPLRASPRSDSAPEARDDEPARIVTEAEFLRRVDADHPAVLALAGGPGTARAELERASTLPNPELSVAREGPTGGAEQVDLTVSWQPPRPDRRKLAVGAARAEVAAADARRDARRLDLHLELRAVYARWALAGARLEALERRAERIAALAERERLRAERGEASGLSVRRLELAATRARGEADRAAAALERARSTAHGWRPDLPDGAEPRLPPLPEPAEDHPAPHPRTVSLEAEIEAARLRRDLAERFVPAPELVAGWQQIDTGSRSVDGPLLGLSWSIPLLDRNRADRARAEARTTATRARLERTRQELAAELAGARAAYEKLRAAALELRRTAARTAPMIDAATAAFRLGEADLTDLLDALRSGTETELAALDLAGDALAAHRELERAAGTPLLPGPNEPAPSEPTEPNPEGDDR